MSQRCKECKRHRCSKCGWSGRRKTGVSGGCPRCGHAGVTQHAVFHRPGVVCSLGRGAPGKHKQYECAWCGRIRRDDKMRRWNGRMECRDEHGCSRVIRQKRMEKA